MSEKKPMNKARKVLVVTIAAMAIGAGGFWFAESQGWLGSVNGALATHPVVFQPPTVPAAAQPAHLIQRPAPAASTQRAPSGPAVAASANAAPASPHPAPAMDAPAAHRMEPMAGPAAVPTGATAVNALAAMGNEPAAHAEASVVDASFFATESTLQRQLRLLKLQEQIRTLQNKINKLSGATAPMAVTPAKVTVSGPAVTSATHPDATTQTVSRVALPMLPAAPAPHPFVLKSVLGVGNNYTAVIADHGVSEAVHVGDHLRGGWAVTSIWPRHVVLSRGHHTTIVRLGD